jgi:hypothetical protein
MGLLKDSQQREISLQRALPVDDIGNASVVKSVSGETVQLYYYNSGVLTVDAGQIAGTLVVAKLAYDNILSKIGDIIGTENDSSFTLANANTFDAQIKFPYRDAELKDTDIGANKLTEIAQAFTANGQYCIDHRTGTFYGKKKNTGTTVSASYKYSSNSVTIETGDIQIGAVEIKDGSADTRASVETKGSTTGLNVSIIDDTGAQITSFGSPSTIADYKSPSDFTATFTSSTTITLSALSGFSITDSSQIVYIKVIPSTGDAQVLVNGSGGVTMTVSSNVITVAGAGTPFASGDVYEVGINALPFEKDPSTQSIKVSQLNNLWNQYTDVETLVTAQDLTDAYADFGAEIDMRGYDTLGVYIISDVNSSEDVDLKVLAKHTLAGTDEYEIDGISVKSLWTTGASDAKTYYEFETNGIPFIQLQAIAGTVGATAGDLTLEIIKLKK